MKTVIVTGLIGSGKSAVCALLRKQGIPVYNADEKTKFLYDTHPSLVTQLEDALGLSLRGTDGRLDRPRLASRIFSDAASRETVEGIVYPLVLADFRAWRSAQEGAPFVVLESAVILTKPLFDGLADAAVLVTAPEDVRLQRVMARDGLPEDAVRARMRAQEIPEDKVDVTLVNDGDAARLEQAVEQVFFQNNSYLCKILNK
ncbi:MAG: dephospho-CoA kinase [Bacteroidales bacterium]|nr:dephospho-CoA kinase [Bacteroidales bacterium]